MGREKIYLLAKYEVISGAWMVLVLSLVNMAWTLGGFNAIVGEKASGTKTPLKH